MPHLTNCHQPVMFVASRKELVTLLKMIFSTLTVAMRYEPANARLFANEVGQFIDFSYLNPSKRICIKIMLMGDHLTGFNKICLVESPHVLF